MRGWRVGSITVAVLVVISVVVFASTWHSEIGAAAKNAPPRIDQGLQARGFALAKLGNCGSCHTAKDGEPYAGGRAITTPFGTIHGTNITPDRETGIGTWSEKAFERAMRQGVDRHGKHLYPAFPYDHFTKASDGDIRALYAYLRSVPAVHNTTDANDLAFPFNIRPLIAGWKLLFLDTGRLESVPKKSDEWNRGRDLVEGLSHCGACHSPRNIMGAEKASQQYRGAMIDGWYAPPLSGKGARGWSEDELQNYLVTGFSRDHGAAAGPMAETVNNLAQAAPSDVAAIAVYVASLTENPGHPMTAINNQDVDAPAKARDLWLGACAQCHESSRPVGPSNGLPLSRSVSVRQSSPTNVVHTIINGVDAYRDRGGAYMPAFGDILTDDEIAMLARYLRRRYSNEDQWSGLENDISKARSSESEDR